jgi:hypothetical protein
LFLSYFIFARINTLPILPNPLIPTLIATFPPFSLILIN